MMGFRRLLLPYKGRITVADIYFLFRRGLDFFNIAEYQKGTVLHALKFPCPWNRSEEPVSLGQWHELRVSRTAKNGILQVDKQKPVEGMAEVSLWQTCLECSCWTVK